MKATVKDKWGGARGRQGHGFPFFCSFIAAIRAFRSSRRLAISLSFSSLLIFARLGVATGVGGDGAAGVSSGMSSQLACSTTGMAGFEGGLGDVAGAVFAEIVAGLGTKVLPLVCWVGGLT